MVSDVVRIGLEAACLCASRDVFLDRFEGELPTRIDSNPDSNPAEHVRVSACSYVCDNRGREHRGDPVLFNETERFWPLIYNNVKGRIVGIAWSPGVIQFDVELDRNVTEYDVEGLDLRWVRDSTVQFDVYEYAGSDEDDDALDTAVPFQVAYAVSIHKAQGLEYDSVKVVVTHDNEDDVSHSIFYTAITRARDQLKVFWTPESQQKVLGSLEHKYNHKDVSLLSSRRGLVSH